jgi:acyl-homoserine lactone acylase PvdQ
MGVCKDFCIAMALTMVLSLAVFIYFVKPPAIPDTYILKTPESDIKIVQDPETGIPQIYADTKLQAFKGLGYVHT